MSKQILGPQRKPSPLSTNELQILREEIAYEMYISKKTDLELIEMFKVRSKNIGHEVAHVRRFPGSFNPIR